MKSRLTKAQWFLIIGGVLLIVVLLNLPKIVSKEPTLKDKARANNILDSTCFYNAIDSINKNADAKLLVQLANTTNIDSAIKFAASINLHLEAAKIAETKLPKTDVASFKKIGGRYYNATKFSNNECVRTYCYEKAIQYFGIALNKDSNDLESKMLLGSSYVEASQNPMQGITLIREVVSKDSNYIDAHLRLAMFAVQSKQYDKAIARFNKIISINPNYIESYLYIGEVYANTGDTSNAVKYLELFKQKSNDVLVNTEVDRYIRSLKKTNN